MLKVDSEHGKLVALGQLELRPSRIAEHHQLRELILNSADAFFKEIGQHVFVIGKDIYPSEQAAPLRADILGLDESGNAVIVVVADHGEQPQLGRAITCAGMVANWKEGDFVKRLTDRTPESLRGFLTVGSHDVERRQRVILVAQTYDSETLTASRWLREQHSLDITGIQVSLAVDPQSGVEYLACVQAFPAPAPASTSTVLQRPDDATVIPLSNGGTPGAGGLEAPKREPEALQAAGTRAFQAEKLESLRSFADGAARNFESLMIAILGGADLSLQELPPESPARARLQEIETAARQASQLTNQLLLYSGRSQPIPKPLDLGEVVGQMRPSLDKLSSEKATLRYELEADLPGLDADGVQMRRTLTNLVSNAVEALDKEGGEVTISTGLLDADKEYLSRTYLGADLPPGKYLYIEVADTGSGMDQETQQKMFDPFFSTKASGRGLGLGEVVGVVRSHGGTIGVDSRLGDGTKVRLLFPLVSHRTIGNTLSAGQEWRGSGTVLVADDDDSSRQSAADMLGRLGFQVLTARDGWEALEVFVDHSDEIKAVLLDLNMPNMDGIEAFREIRRIRPLTPVVLSSGYTGDEASGRFGGEGFARFIQRPFRFEELSVKMRAVFQDSRFA